MSLSCYWISYDIPDDSGIRNPSGRLRQRGFRINGSDWIIQEQDIPWTLIHHMQQWGATVHCMKWDSGESEKIGLLAVHYLKRDILASIESCRTSLRNLERGRNGVIPQDVDLALKAEKKYRTQSKAIVKRLQGLLRDYQLASNRFGLTPESVGLNATHAAIELIQDGIAERARVYTNAIQQLRSVAGDRDAMVVTARQGNVHAGVMADYMRDNGLETEADTLQSRFGV